MTTTGWVVGRPGLPGLVDPVELGGAGTSLVRGVEDAPEHVGDHVGRCPIHCPLTLRVDLLDVAVLGGDGTDVVRLVVGSPVGKGRVGSRYLEWGNVEGNPALQGVRVLLRDPQAVDKVGGPLDADLLEGPDGGNVPRLNEGGPHGHGTLVLIIEVP